MLKQKRDNLIVKNTFIHLEAVKHPYGVRLKSKSVLYQKNDLPDLDFTKYEELVAETKSPSKPQKTELAIQKKKELRNEKKAKKIENQIQKNKKKLEEEEEMKLEMEKKIQENEKLEAEKNEKIVKIREITENTRRPRRISILINEEELEKVGNFQSTCEEIQQVIQKKPILDAPEAPGYIIDNPGPVMTTLMIRNLPTTMTQRLLMEKLNTLDFCGKYDFVYLPVDYKTLNSVGYAFVNFIYPEDAKTCISLSNQFSLRSKKRTFADYARIQGLEANIQHFRNSPIMNLEERHLKPVLVDTFGNVLDFPEPTMQLTPIRPRRSKFFDYSNDYDDSYNKNEHRNDYKNDYRNDYRKRKNH